MFNFDFLNKPEPLRLFLCKPDDTIVCELNAIDEESANIALKLNNQYELSFDYKRYLSTDDGIIIESNGYQNINIGMNILVVNSKGKQGLFRLKYPPMKYDGDSECKSITAYSIECELEAKDLVNFKINTGEPDSLEYLVSYDNNETETLLNEYTGLPYDYIVFYNTYPEQLSELLYKYSDNTTYTDSSAISEIMSYCSLIPRLKSKITSDTEGNTSLTEYVEYTYDAHGENVISIYLFNNFNLRIFELIDFYTKYRDQLSLITLALDQSNWTIGDIDSSLYNKKFQFDVDGTNIYSFLTNDVAGTARCVFDFDIVNRKVNVVLAENIGKDSCVIIDKKNFLNSLEISCNDDNLYTRYNVSGGNDIGIQYVNFGTSRIDDISWFLNARDENGKRIYVSDSLAEKYSIFEEDREIAREKYIEYTTEYNQALTDIDEIKYRVPNDSLQNDWDTFTDTELEGLLTVYNNLLVTCISLYKEDYGSVGCNSDGSVNEAYIKNTEYWYDYYAYKITIEQIEAAIVARANDSSYAEIDNESILNIINAWETEWTLYGTVELQNKIAAFNNNLAVLSDGEAVILKENSDEAKPWSDLTENQKVEYGSLEINYQYDVYMKYYNYRNSCQAYLETLMSQLEILEAKRDTAQVSRTAIVKLMDISKYDRGELSQIVNLNYPEVLFTFTDSEIKTINLLYIDKNYSNENLLTTSLDTTVTEIDVQKELLEDAREELSIESKPQITFQTEIDNLLAIPEFKDFEFDIGNYVTVEYYDNYYIKLRLYSISFNPCIPETQPTTTFTNYITSRSERSDVSYILNQSMGSSSSSSSRSGSGSGSSASFGDSDKVDVTISNTMLAKLLNTEMFGTRVSNIILDTIKVNQLTAKYAKFDGLAKGTTTIDGQCVKTGVIISNNYNGTITEKSTGVTDFDLDNTEGSILNINDGTFSFGGGKVFFDGDSLCVEGNIVATTLASGGRIGATTGQDGIFIDSLGNLYAGSENQTQIRADGTFSFGGGKMIYDGTKLTFAPDVTISWSQITDKGDTITAADIPTKVSDLLNDSGYQTESQVTTITQNTVTTTYVNALAVTAKEVSADWVYAGKIKANQIYSGKLTSIDGVTTVIDLDDGTFSFANGNLVYDGSTLELTGKIKATSGTIGGFTIASSSIYNTKPSLTSSLSGVYIGTNGISLGTGSTFKVTSAGALTATDATITGTITTSQLTATGGKIANFTISNGYLYNGIKFGTDNSCGISCGTDLGGDDSIIFWAGNGDFRVNIDGKFFATAGEISVYSFDSIGFFADYTGDGVLDYCLNKKSFSVRVYNSNDEERAYFYLDTETSVPEIPGRAIVFGNYEIDLRTNNNVYIINENTNTTVASISVTGVITASARVDTPAIELTNSTPYIDFHYANSTSDYTSRIIDSGTYLQILAKPLQCQQGMYWGSYRCIYSGNNTILGIGYKTSSSTKYMEFTTTEGAFGVDCWSSDIRLKKNIVDSSVSGLSVINSIRHCSFDWIDGKQGSVPIGYIAQELQEIAPDLVFTVPQPDGENKELFQISASKLLPYVTKAIQELSNEVSQLKEEIKLLKCS